MAPTNSIRGVVIGFMSAFGIAVFLAILIVLFYCAKFTTKGRIFLDGIRGPGEYDDEQAFAREEEEALETMDDMQRTEYLRAKGMAAQKHFVPLGENCCVSLGKAVANYVLSPSQHSSRQTLPNPWTRKYHYHSTWLFKKRAFRPGSLSPSWRSPTASSKREQRSSSLTRSAAS